MVGSAGMKIMWQKGYKQLCLDFLRLSQRPLRRAIGTFRIINDGQIAVVIAVIGVKAAGERFKLGLGNHAFLAGGTTVVIVDKADKNDDANGNNITIHDIGLYQSTGGNVVY